MLLVIIERKIKFILYMHLKGTSHLNHMIGAKVEKKQFSVLLSGLELVRTYWNMKSSRYLEIKPFLE